ncbi:MAG: hypothetical protein ACKV2V_31430 [Blastocatellia bacterium]
MARIDLIPMKSVSSRMFFRILLIHALLFSLVAQPSLALAADTVARAAARHERLAPSAAASPGAHDAAGPVIAPVIAPVNDED